MSYDEVLMHLVHGIEFALDTNNELDAYRYGQELQMMLNKQALSYSHVLLCRKEVFSKPWQAH